MSGAEVTPNELAAAIESQHGGTATLAQSVPVTERHAGPGGLARRGPCVRPGWPPEGDPHLRLVVADRGAVTAAGSMPSCTYRRSTARLRR